MLSACTKFLTTPISIFIGKILQPVIDKMDLVASSSEKVIEDFTKIDHESEKDIHSFDVEQLYPSLQKAQVIGATRHALTKHFSENPQRLWGRLVEFVISLLTIVLDTQFLKFFGQLHRQVKGVTTGMPCAGHVANIFMHGLELP